MLSAVQAQAHHYFSKSFNTGIRANLIIFNDTLTLNWRILTKNAYPRAKPMSSRPQTRENDKGYPVFILLNLQLTKATQKQEALTPKYQGANCRLPIEKSPKQFLSMQTK